MSVEQLDIQEQLETQFQQELAHTQAAIEYMATFGIKPEGRFGLFSPPDIRQQEIHRIPYTHRAKQQVIYETEKGEFSAKCPFSGIPDFGTVKIEYLPKSSLVELKSLKYYLLSWRNIGAAQEDITAYMYEDLKKALIDPSYLVITTVYNVRGGINTTCVIDSRVQEA
jgi:7-cyano-7-deazaguanine reductase